MAETPRVLNKYRDEIPEGSVHILRPSRWGNPFHPHAQGKFKADERADQVRKYRSWAKSPEQAEYRREARRLLKGKHLVCCCAPLRCHGDVLIKIANSKGPGANG